MYLPTFTPPDEAGGGAAGGPQLCTAAPLPSWAKSMAVGEDGTRDPDIRDGKSVRKV
jgi:hypothetical protein